MVEKNGEGWMLGLKSVTISGFRSFGVEETTIRLDNLGPTLIIGHNGDDVSNGAGKSTLVDAILWCLFGKMPSSERPANNVIGWGLDECYVSLETDTGHTIKRFRRKNANELFIYKDQTDITHSTSTNTQATLNKMFDLDYELFIAGTFFGQFSKPFLELPDAKRRKSLERLLHLHRMNVRAEIAGEKVKELNQMQSMNAIAYDDMVSELSRIESDIVNTKQKMKPFEIERSDKIKKMTMALSTMEEKLTRDGNLIDIQDLKKKWEVVSKVQSKINAMRSKIDDYNSNELLNINSKIDSRNRIMDEWKKKSGGICAKCLQKIDPNHAKKHIDEIIEEMSKLVDAKTQITTTINQLRTTANKAEQKLEEIKPKITAREAELHNASVNNLVRDISQHKLMIESKQNERNPYETLIDEYNKQLIKTKEKLRDHDLKTTKLNVFIRHVDYIYKMYHDKNKLKSLILTDLIPYLNNRLSYYIEAVGLDTKLEFNQYLQCKSDKWDYVWFSGGEKKRIDVALMFALYDLHSAIYGKQCNILVLDEIDGRLDKSGIQSFVEIIWKDFVNNDQMTDRPDSILVISHKSEMFDAFPTKIIVEKRPPGVNGKSTVRIEGL